MTPISSMQNVLAVSYLQQVRLSNLIILLFVSTFLEGRFVVM